jgi:formate transporter
MSADAYMKPGEGFGLDAYSPAEIQAKVESLGVKKAKMPFLACFVLSVVAGVGIALGGMFCCIVLADASLSFAVQKILGGVAFCLGLTLVVVGGAELFTGNCLIVMAWANRQLSSLAVLRNWSIVWIGNLVGSLALVFMLFMAHFADANHGAVGDAIVHIAAAKIAPDFTTLFFKGVLCNLLVCLAVWLTYAGRGVADKVAGLILPVSAFVAAGFEHCVANMFFLPMAWVLVQTGHVPAGMDVSTIDLAGIVHNLIPATLGNIVGGAGFVGLVYWLVYRKSLGGLAPLPPSEK